jgi:hypothetical protein
VRFDIRWNAPAGTEFATTLPAGMVGQEVPVVVGDATHPGRVVAAEVLDDGAAVLLTVEVDGAVVVPADWGLSL